MESATIVSVEVGVVVVAVVVEFDSRNLNVLVFVMDMLAVVVDSRSTTVSAMIRLIDNEQKR